MRLLLAFLFCTTAYSQTIISDYDDTFRITHSYNFGRSVGSYFKKTKYLADYKILFQQVWDGPKYLLSSSPALLLKKIKKDLSKNRISYEKFIARKLKYQFDKKYKVKMLKGLLNKTQGPVLLIGDDIHGDESVYQEVKSNFPTRVPAYYIRNSKKVIKAAYRYNYALDIALEEWFSKRMDLGQLSNFIDQLTKAPLKLINIKGYSCPILNLTGRKLAIIARLPGSLPQRVSEIYLKYSKDCFKKQSRRF